MGRIGRILHELHHQGWAKTLRHLLMSLTDCRYCFLREDVRRISPLPASNCFKQTNRHPRIAVHIHLFYPQIAEEVIRVTNRIPYPFDCYVSTDCADKAFQIRQAFEANSHAAYLQVDCFPNRGRDVAPLIAQMAPVLGRYDYLCHLHGKHSPQSAFGEQWRTYLFDQMLGTSEVVAGILCCMENEKDVGLVFPATYPKVKRFLGWRGNKPNAEKLLKRMGIDSPLPNRPLFPAGDMFWARTSAIKPAFYCGLSSEDFAPETGQLEHTMAHCLERSWGCIAQARHYRVLQIDSLSMRREGKQAS